MSLQHQNKSLPKHLQHARLQKEEDEEQWISGEELCTEGSSDEESKVKDFKKKLKGSAQSSASSLKSRAYSSSSASIKENSDSNADPSSSKHVEWRPKRDEDYRQYEDKNSFYDIKAERLDTEMKWKTTLEELQFNKNLYKNSNLSETQTDTNKLLYDFQKNEYNFDNLINHSEYITDNIVTLDKEIETFGTILEGCKKDRMVYEQDICCQINSLNICKVTTQSTDKFHKICNFKRRRSAKTKRRKSGSMPKLYSRANKFKTSRRSKMDENTLTKEQSNRLEDLLAENDDNENGNNNCFKHTNEQLENMAIINGKLKTLQEKSDDADLNGKTSEETVGVVVADEENREWKNYFKVKDEKLRKINNRLKVLQNLKSTENNQEPDNNTEEKQQ